MEAKIKSFLFGLFKLWPWQIFMRLNPVFKFVVITLTIAGIAFDPIDWTTIAVGGAIGWIVFQKLAGILILAILAALGMFILWALIQGFFALITFAVIVYVLTTIISLGSILLGINPNKALFITNPKPRRQ